MAVLLRICVFVSFELVVVVVVVVMMMMLITCKISLRRVGRRRLTLANEPELTDFN